MEPRAAAAAAAHRRVKRAMGLLRAAAAALAPEAAELDLVGEVHLEQGQADVSAVLELLELARHRHGALDVVILAAPRHAPPGRTAIGGTRPAGLADVARDASRLAAASRDA